MLQNRYSSCNVDEYFVLSKDYASSPNIMQVNFENKSLLYSLDGMALLQDRTRENKYESYDIEFNSNLKIRDVVKITPLNERYEYEFFVEGKEALGVVIDFSRNAYIKLFRKDGHILFKSSSWTLTNNIELSKVIMTLDLSMGYNLLVIGYDGIFTI
jgi:hypothetical protein